VDVVDVRIDDFDSVVESPNDDMIPYDPDAPSPITPATPIEKSGSVSQAYVPGSYLGVSSRVRAGSLSAHGRDQMPLIVASGKVGELWARGAQLGEQVGRVVVEDAQVR
jgi:hypothetical protein